jgi:hypothetical protein
MEIYTVFQTVLASLAGLCLLAAGGYAAVTAFTGPGTDH